MCKIKQQMSLKYILDENLKANKGSPNLNFNVASSFDHAAAGAGGFLLYVTGFRSEQG